VATEIATGYISIVPSMRGFGKQLTADASRQAATAGDASGKSYASGMLRHVKTIAAGLVGAFAVTKGVQLFKDSIKEASDLNESLNAVKVTFGKNAEGITQLGEKAATALGLSKTEFNALSVRFSNFAETVAGKGGDVVGTMDDLTTRASDFASVMNLDVNQAAELFQSGLAGETEPLRKYGIDLSAAAVQAHALAKGIWDGKGQMSEAQKVQARYSLLMKSTNKTAGDFANTSDGLANRQRIANAQWKNAKATIGQSLLPVMEALTGFIQEKVVPAVQRFGEWFQRDGGPAIGRFGAMLRDNVMPVLSGLVGWLIQNRNILLPLAGIIAGIVGAYKTYVMVVNLAKMAQIALNFALSMNPIGIVVMAIGALVAALVLLWNKNEGFRNAVTAAWEAIKQAALVVWGWIKGYLEGIWNAIKAAVDVVWPAIQKIIEVVWAAISWWVEHYVKAVWTVITTVWDWIKTATQFAWDLIKGFVIDPIVAIWTKVNEVVGNLVTWVGARWDDIKRGTQIIWGKIRDHVIDPIVRAKNRVGEVVDNIGTKLSGVWDTIKTTASTAWNNVKDAIVGPIKAVWGFIKDALGITDKGDIAGSGPLSLLVGVWTKVVDAIGEAFGKVKSAIATPIKEAFEWVNTNIISPINTKILDKFKAPNLPLLPVPAAMASGGWVGGVGGPTDDKNLVWLSRGEYVVNARSAGQYGSLLEQLNNGQPVTASAVQSTVTSAFNPGKWLKNLWEKGAGGAIRALTGPGMDYLRGQFGGSFSGDLVLGALDQMFDVFAKIGDKLQMAPSKLMEALYQYMKAIEGHHGYYQECLATIHAALDSLQDDFGFVTGSLISTSDDPNEIIHTLGRNAFNTTDPPRGGLVFWEFPGAYGHIAVATGKGNESINNWDGDTIDVVDNIGSNGYVGWLPPERFVSKFDSGGMLPPGWTMAFNGTGKPEPILTSDQWESLSQRGVTNNWVVHATEAPTVDAVMSAWHKWEALQGV